MIVNGMRLYCTIFLVSASIAAGAFWQFAGRSLQYGVFAGGELLYKEEFSEALRIGVTVLVGFTVGTLAAWLVYAFRRDYRQGRRR